MQEPSRRFGFAIEPAVEQPPVRGKDISQLVDSKKSLKSSKASKAGSRYKIGTKKSSPTSFFFRVAGQRP
jgi:hypothetical protein